MSNVWLRPCLGTYLWFRFSYSFVRMWFYEQRVAPALFSALLCESMFMCVIVRVCVCEGVCLWFRSGFSFI